MAWLDRMRSWFDAHPDAFWVITGASVALLVIGLLALPVILLRVPPDYFVAEAKRGNPVVAVLRNVLGAVVLLAGVAMLALPGQGLLTILAALLLLDVPGKRRLALSMVRRESVRSWVDWIREKGGKPPLQVPEDDS